MTSEVMATRSCRSSLRRPSAPRSTSHLDEKRDPQSDRRRRTQFRRDSNARSPNEQAVAFAHRNFETLRKMEDHLAARPRASGLDEAEMARRDRRSQRELELILRRCRHSRNSAPADGAPSGRAIPGTLIATSSVWWPRVGSWPYVTGNRLAHPTSTGSSGVTSTSATNGPQAG